MANQLQQSGHSTSLRSSPPETEWQQFPWNERRPLDAMKTDSVNGTSRHLRTLGVSPWWCSPYSAWGFMRRLQVRPSIAASESLIGFHLAALVMASVFAAHWLSGVLQVRDLQVGALLKVAPQALMLEGAVLEELVYRGLLLTALLHFWRRTGWAIVVSALLFGLAHASRPHATPLSILSNSLGGVMYAVPYLLTGRLYFSVGLHFGWNWAQGIVFGFPMSGVTFSSVMIITVTGPAWVTGAAYGPEGGVIGIGARLLVVVVSIWLLWSHIRAAGGQGVSAPSVDGHS
jgi:membrane protease YdiL (CAAX protease family)